MNIYKDAFALLSDRLVATFCVPDAEEAAAVDGEESLTDVDGCCCVSVASVTADCVALPLFSNELKLEYLPSPMTAVSAIDILSRVIITTP